MQVELILSNGSVVTESVGNLVIELTDRYLLIRNTGAPDNHDLTSAGPTPEPIGIHSLRLIDCPDGFEIPLAGQRGATRLDASTWLLIDPTDFHHSLDGGDTYYLPFQWPDPLPTSIPSAIPMRQEWLSERKVLDVLALYTFGSGRRDFGHRLIPVNLHARYPDIPERAVSGWYGFGDIYAAGGEGFTNCHYDADYLCFIRALVAGDENAFHLGMFLLRQKCAYGLIDTAVPREACWQRGWWRGEKGYRRGAAMLPSSNKEWDRGLTLGVELVDDTLINDSWAVRHNCLFYRKPWHVWDSGGGARGIGYAIRNLRAHGLPTGEFVSHVLSKVPGVVFPNNNSEYSRTWQSAAEEAIAHIELAKVVTSSQDRTKVGDMIDWLLTYGMQRVNGRWQVAYQVRTDGQARQMDTPLQGCFWAGLWDAADSLGVYYPQEKRSDWKAGILEAIPADMSHDEPSMGDSSEKWAHIIAGMIVS